MSRNQSVIILFLTWVLGVGASHSLASGSTTEAYRHYCLGVLYESYGDWQASLEEYLKAIESDPAAGAIHIKRGGIYLKQRKVDLAIFEYEKALQKNYHYPYVIHFLLGVAHHINHDIDRAIGEYQKALEQDSRHVSSYLALGDLYSQKEMYSEALQTYERAVLIRPDIPLLWFKLGLLYRQEDETGRSVHAFQKAIALRKKWTEPRLGLAQAYEKLSENALAIEQYEEIIKISALNVAVHRRLASLYHAEGRLDRAIEIYRMLCKVYPENDGHILALGYLYLKNNDSSSAVAILENLYHRKKSSMELFFILGMAYESLNRFDEACEIYEAGLNQWGENEAMRFHLASSYAEAEKLDLAQKHFNLLLMHHPRNSDAMNYLAYLWIDHAIHLDDAIVLLKRALEIEPHNGAYLDSMGWAYYKKGDYQNALVFLERALKQEGSDPLILDHYADVLFDRGDWSQAVRVWKKAFRLDPDNRLLQNKIKSVSKKIRIGKDSATFLNQRDSHGSSSSVTR